MYEGVENKPGALSKHSTKQHCGPSTEIENVMAGEDFSTFPQAECFVWKGG